jgi:type IV pilus assembly protein PilE
MTRNIHPLPQRLMHRMRGITLIELMIVVVIIGFLAVIAYPNYREFAARAKRNEAKAALLQIATQQERFYLQNNTFTCDMTQLGFPAAAGFVTDSRSYTVDVTACNAANFTAQAVYNMGGAEAGKCAFFQLDGRGTRISNPDGDCWIRTR